MKRLMISAMGSGSGKTVVTCGLLALLKRRGYAVRSVKCGPDYIDPMFHSRVLGVMGANADLFLMGEASVRKTLSGNEIISEGFGANAPEDDGILVIAEGAMGFYDGIGGSDVNSAWEIADRTETPVILVLKSRGQSLSLAAQVQGFLHFRPPSHIVGLILSECSPTLYSHLEPILTRETGLPVLGYLPPMKEAEIPQRHLGLVTANEIADFRQRFDAIASQMERTVDVERMLGLFSDSATILRTQTCSVEKEQSAVVPSGRKKMSRCRIAVAYDEAFCFYYKESLDALREAGAEIVFFSPIHDGALPADVSGLYLGGGYPELYARELGENREMRAEVKSAFDRKMPIIAECGGFLYLQKHLEDEGGGVHEMVGAFAGCGQPSGRLVRFGYIYLAADKDSLLFRKGEVIPAHEFHHWDTDDNGNGLAAVRAGEVIRGGGDGTWDGWAGAQVDGNRTWRCAFVSEHLYAGFPHLALGGELPLAERFVAAARKFGNII
ncbi:MAG: cobyrinate a,c-diamide synthase [Lachnospiraceae bacterium]|nr:cobyrinate a,c-diamide synthase [Lachnospiraceae bacterium]